MRKQMTDEQLEQMGLLLKQQHELAIETWRIAMKAMPINSPEYRRICAPGKAIQRAHDALRSVADNERWSDDGYWSDEKLQETFSYNHCGFS